MFIITEVRMMTLLIKILKKSFEEACPRGSMCARVAVCAYFYVSSEPYCFGQTFLLQDRI